MSVRESESHASYGKNDRHDGFSLKWCRYVYMTPLYKEVSHLHASTDRVKIRAWAPPEICLNVLITPSRGIPSLKPTTGHVMGQPVLSRQDKLRWKKRERERLPLYCIRSTYTTSTSFIASFNLSFVLRDTEAINKQVGHPLHNSQT